VTGIIRLISNGSKRVSGRRGSLRREIRGRGGDGAGIGVIHRVCAKSTCNTSFDFGGGGDGAAAKATWLIVRLCGRNRGRSRMRPTGPALSRPGDARAVAGVEVCADSIRRDPGDHISPHRRGTPTCQAWSAKRKRLESWIYPHLRTEKAGPPGPISRQKSADADRRRCGDQGRKCAGALLQPITSRVGF